MTNLYLKEVKLRQSPNDQRAYKAVELKNKLKVIMISDPTIEKSACAISVGVGSMCDPDRSLGLAHFLQHMLFMGSENYPSHNEYSSFIGGHGGADNAYTDMEETNYFFEISNEHFPQGLKRLADFFRKPILNPDCVQKQRQAVHQQYMLWTSDDNSRKWQIIHTLAQGQYSRFSIGNQDTLNHKYILEDLRNYYDKTYSSNIINAVLVSNLSIQQQEKLLPSLEAIENKNYAKEKFIKPFSQNRLGKMVFMQSIKDEYIMQFFWVIDDLKPLYKYHIAQYLSFVLGHESQGSLSAYLECQGYTSQTISYKQYIYDSTIIGLQLTMTQPGTVQYLKVYEIVMQYISQLKPQEFIYENLKSRSNLKWQFLEKIGSSSYSSKIASKLHYVDMEHVLDYKTEFEPFDANLIAKYISSLNQSNLLLFLSSSNPIQQTVVQPYLGAKYKVQKLPKWNKIKKPKFNFLKTNKFLPVITKIQPQKYDIPKKIAHNVTLFKRNNVCRGGVTLHLYSNVDKVFLQLYEHWSNMMLKQSTYDASMLDSNMQFSSDRSIWINLFGYNQVALKLVQIIGQQIQPILMKDKKKSEIFFQIVRQRMMQQYENYYLADTDNALSTDLQRLLNAKTQSTIEQTIQILQKMTMKNFAQKIAYFWKNIQLQWIIVGNFDEAEILETVKKFQSTLTNNINVIKEQPCLKITQNIHYTVKIPSPQIGTSGTLVYYEFDQNIIRNKLIIDLLVIYINQPFFDDLRTTKQLGYIAQTIPSLNSGILGLKFVVVSSNSDPSILQKQIVNFVQKFFSQLKDLSHEKLQNMKAAVLARQCEPFKSLQQQYDFIVHQINGRTYQFNRKDKQFIQKLLSEISLQQLVNTVNKILVKHLSVYIVADIHVKDFEKSNIKGKQFDELRKNGQYHPDYQHPAKHLV